MDKQGNLVYDKPYKIVAHYPAVADGQTYIVSAEYKSENDFQNAKASDFYASAIKTGTDAGADLAMKAGDIFTTSALFTDLSFLAKEALARYAEEKLAQYSANIVNKEAIQDLIQVNIRQQILKSGFTKDAEEVAVEAAANYTTSRCIEE